MEWKRGDVFAIDLAAWSHCVILSITNDTAKVARPYAYASEFGSTQLMGCELFDISLRRLSEYKKMGSNFVR